MNSGEDLYNSKTLNHSFSEIGGNSPKNGLHSTMDKPLPVRRVIPPITIMVTIIKQINKNQTAICLLKLVIGEFILVKYIKK